MAIEKLARKGVLKIASYIPGKSIEEVQKAYGKKRWIKLASNENLMGPSPKATAAIRKELANIHLYPEGSCTVLREALAKKLNLPEDMIVASNGGDNLLHMIANAFVNEGDEVIMADPTFSVYTHVTQSMGGKPVPVKLKNFTHDLDAMLKRVSPKTKLIFICNPNNPTGTTVSKELFDAFLPKLPKRVIVVLDEAYGDFVEDPFTPNGLDYVKKGEQILVLRTFSKVYGLAGLRIGYVFGKKDLIDCLYRVRDPFPVNRLAQIAALASLNDEDHIIRSIQTVYEGKRYLYNELEKCGLAYVSSQANFILINFKMDCEEIYKAFLKRGVIVRPGKSWGYPSFIRMTIGRKRENKRFIKALRKILKAYKSKRSK